MKATLVESHEIAPEVKHFLFQAPDVKHLRFKPGQFVSFNEMVAGKKAFAGKFNLDILSKRITQDELGQS